MAAALRVGLLLLAAVPALPIVSRCTACEAVAAEIEGKLDGESELRSLDVNLQGRIGPSGQRMGKRIPYKLSEIFSSLNLNLLNHASRILPHALTFCRCVLFLVAEGELRVMELLDGLCEEVKENYQLTPRKPKKWARTDWMQADLRDKWKSDAKLTSQRNQLRNYCDDIMGEHDEEIVKALQSMASQDTDTLPPSQWLCRSVTTDCARYDAKAEKSGSAGGSNIGQDATVGEMRDVPVHPDYKNLYSDDYMLPSHHKHARTKPNTDL